MLPGFLPGQGRSRGVFRAFRPPGSPHDARHHQWSSTCRHRDLFRPGPGMAVRGQLLPHYPHLVNRHFQEKGWAWTALLAYTQETGLLIKLSLTEAIIAFEHETEVWLPESRDQACAVIGKFTQGSQAGGKRLTRRLVTDPGELDFLMRDTRQSGTLVSAPQKCPLGHILTYYDGFHSQYAHLRARMLAYAHINLLETLCRFTPEEAVRIATDSIYVQKTVVYKLEGVEALVGKTKCNCGKFMCATCILGEEYLSEVSPAQWRDKGEELYMPNSSPGQRDAGPGRDRHITASFGTVAPGSPGRYQKTLPFFRREGQPSLKKNY